jgi:uncharacterized protein
MTAPDTGLRAPANRVAPRARLLWGLGALLPGLAVAAVLVAGSLMDWFDVPGWLWPAYVVVVVAYAIVMPLVRYRVHRWESTETAVYTQTGWLSRELRIAPMSRVQTVDFDQGLLSRLLGLASVTVTTASAAGPLKVEALEEAVAHRLVEELTHRAEADQGDAT